MLQEFDGNLDIALTAATEHIGIGEKLRELLSHRFSDFLVVTQPISGTAGKQVIPAVSLAVLNKVGAISHGRELRPLLLREQSRDVVQSLFAAVLVVTVLLDQPLLNGGNLVLRVLIGPSVRCY